MHPKRAPQLGASMQSRPSLPQSAATSEHRRIPAERSSHRCFARLVLVAETKSRFGRQKLRVVKVNCKANRSKLLC